MQINSELGKFQECSGLVSKDFTKVFWNVMFVINEKTKELALVQVEIFIQRQCAIVLE